MSQPNENQNTAPNVDIKDKRKPAPGVLPKNAQTWVVIGLTTVIMLMLWVSGPAKGAKSSQKTDAPKTETVAGLSPAEISARLELVDLERRNKRPLQASLEAAAMAFERGQVQTGINLLESFQKKVRAQIQPRHPELANQLFGASASLINALQ